MASVWEAWGVARDVSALADAAGDLVRLEGRLRDTSEELAELRSATTEFSPGLSAQVAGAMRGTDAVLAQVHVVSQRAERVL